MRNRSALHLIGVAGSVALLGVVALVSGQAGQAPPGAANRPVPGVNGMVSSAHPLASAAGVEILKAGGNAFDAAVAVAAALNVVEPENSGIGGYGTIVVYDARKREARFLNASGRIPFTVNSDDFRAPTPNYLENRRGAKAVSTPGNLHAWESLSTTYGRLPWTRVLAPAVTLAEEGFVLSDGGARTIASSFTAFPAHARGIFGVDGRPLAAGERLVQKDLARSLRLIQSQGAAALYGGPLGNAVDRTMRQAGGFLATRDLEGDRPEWRVPIRISYRGFDVVTASPPANAFDFLVRLGLMGRFDVPALGHNSTPFLHRFAEVTKHGFWVRLRYAGDPDVAPPPLQMLLSEKYWAEQAARLDLAHATRFVYPGEPPSHHTTHFVIADRWGNVVSATQTLGNSFGSRIMPEGTGFWLNNSLAYCTFEPKGNPMDAHAGRRKLSGDCPTIVMRDGRPWIAIGTPGGHTIGQTVPQILMNVIDFKMDIAQAIAAPRVSFVEPDQLAVESAVLETVRQQLQAMGHNVQVTRGLGNATGLTIEYDTAGRIVRFTGAADPRGQGRAIGY
jgi:gamma-glutamyltranspeptidase / glutathione hydrolase